MKTSVKEAVFHSQTKTVKVCEVGWSENDIYCYKFIQNPTALNWIEAQNRCSQESGFLAYILDNKAQTVVNRLRRPIVFLFFVSTKGIFE